MTITARNLLMIGLYGLLAEPGASVLADEPRFERIVIDDNFPGGYQVEVADVNGDGKPDIIALGGGTCAWYENPTWKKRIISTSKDTPGIISSATTDLDGDGKAEVAIAYEFEMNQPKQGKLLLAVQGASIDAPWTLRPIADVPSIHRVRWADLFPGDDRVELIAAPIFGPNSKPPAYNQDTAKVEIYACSNGSTDLKLAGTLNLGRPVIHAIDIVKSQGEGEKSHPGALLTADNLGVGLIRPVQESIETSKPKTVIPGSAGAAPKRGSSEVHLGHLADGRTFLATIDPWHGSEVAVSIHPASSTDVLASTDWPPRFVLDNTLDDGHALWTADVDKDGNDEVFAGHRGKDHRVSVYRFDGKVWNKSVLDREIAAQDLRGGDLDGDGTPDVVSIGGATHNVVWYRHRP